jgi:RNA polymerase sigma-70 factor (ECF subfamily)
MYRYDVAVNVTNDGFVKIFRHIERFRYTGEGYPERRLMAWIKRIVINTAIDELRKNHMTPEIGAIPGWAWEKSDDSQKADQQLMYKELISYVKHLPPMYRTVFNMFVIDGCTHFEIAASLGISTGTSRSNLSRARTILQRIINERMKLNKPAKKIHAL